MPSVPAMQVIQNEFVFYSTVMSGKELLEASFVRRRNEDPQKGFNRTLTETRAREIARYLENDRQSIPSDVILSAQPAAELTYADGQLSWSGASKSFLVLDGQHRLFSMRYTHVDYEFACAIYQGLTSAQEVRFFIDINTRQRGVPPALLLDIKQLAGVETSLEERLRRVYDQVSGDPSSPLRGLLSPSATRPGYVSRVTFNSALGKRLEAGALADMAPDDQAKLVVNYLTACDRTIRASGAKRNQLTNSTMLHGFFEVFDEVVQVTMERDRQLKPANLVETLRPLTTLDFDAYIGSNRPSRARLVADLRAALTSRPVVTTDML